MHGSNDLRPGNLNRHSRKAHLYTFSGELPFPYDLAFRSGFLQPYRTMAWN